jgi:hypothetical protein
MDRIRNIPRDPFRCSEARRGVGSIVFRAGQHSCRRRNSLALARVWSLGASSLSRNRPYLSWACLDCVFLVCPRRASPPKGLAQHSLARFYFPGRKRIPECFLTRNKGANSLCLMTRAKIKPESLMRLQGGYPPGGDIAGRVGTAVDGLARTPSAPSKRTSAAAAPNRILRRSIMHDHRLREWPRYSVRSKIAEFALHPPE